MPTQVIRPFLSNRSTLDRESGKGGGLSIFIYTFALYCDLRECSSTFSMASRNKDYIILFGVVSAFKASFLDVFIAELVGLSSF